MRLSKIKVISAITAATLVVGGILTTLPLLTCSINQDTINQTNNNINISKTNNDSSTAAQVVNSVDDIVIEKVNENNHSKHTYYSFYAIVKNKGVQEIYVWGNNASGQLGLGHTASVLVPTKLPILLSDNTIIKSFSIASYSSHILLETNDKQNLYVWGGNQYGQLGLGTTSPYSAPQELPLSNFGNNKITKIELLNYTGYAFTENSSGKSEIYVWGRNGACQLGLGDTNDRLVPTLFTIPAATVGWNIKQFVLRGFSGDSSFMLFEKDGIIQPYVWGSNTFSETGLGHKNRINSPTILPLTKFGITTTVPGYIRDFQVGTYSSYALVSRSDIDYLYTWGNNDYGQLGHNTTSEYLTPTNIPTSWLGNGQIVKVILRNLGFIALVNVNGVLKIYSWGYGDLGVNGNNDTTTRPLPYEIPASRFNNGTIKSYSFIDNNAMVLADVGGTPQMFVWGDNNSGQLGINSTAKAMVPRQFTTPLFDIASIKSFNSMGSAFFEIEKNGKTEYYGCGRNDYGQLGISNTTNQLTLTPILPTKFTQPKAKEYTTNLSVMDAYDSINSKGILSKTELEKYVDLSSIPTTASISIDNNKTTFNHELGTIDLVINSNQYYQEFLFDPQAASTTYPKQYTVQLTGFRKTTDFFSKPVAAKPMLTDDINNIDNLLSPLVSNNIVINDKREKLEQYFELSSIPASAEIKLNWTTDVVNNTVNIEFVTSQVYDFEGKTVPQAHSTDLSIGLPNSSVNIALIAGLSGGAAVVLIVSVMITVKMKHNKKSKVWDF